MYRFSSCYNLFQAEASNTSCFYVALDEKDEHPLEVSLLPGWFDKFLIILFQLIDLILIETRTISSIISSQLLKLFH